jgi:hypothetical protein
MQENFMRPLQATSYKLQAGSGQTALSLIFVIGGIIVLFSATLAFLALSFLNSTYGFQAANRAAALAEGGVDDAMLQLARDREFESGGYCVPYHEDVGSCPSDHAQVTATQNTPGIGQVTVVSEAVVRRYRRKVQAVFAVNASTSLVRLISQEQAPL